MVMIELVITQCKSGGFDFITKAYNATDAAANISATASVLFYTHLSALCFLCPFRLTFYIQNAVYVPLDSIEFIDLFFQLSIVGVQGFFLLLELFIFHLQLCKVRELGDTHRP